MKWIEKKKTLSPRIIRNWKVVPDLWWKQGRKKDYELIFGKTNLPSDSNSQNSKFEKY
jgi:hypothetical protein